MQSSIAPALRRILLAAALAAGLLGAGTAAAQQPGEAVSDPRRADAAYAEAQRLLDDGRPAEARAAIGSGLAASPNDPRLRFLAAMMLARDGRDAEAIDAFVALTRDFPELPEPYNNLAALHAARGDLDRARQALEDAIRALPSYALAHENLGDLQWRLAMRSWQTAARLQPDNPSVADKLRLAQQLSGQMPAAPKP